MRRERSIQVQRDSVNADTGEFDAVLFTNGEASDGHILDIAGGEIPDEIPLFVNHDPDPVGQLGTLRRLKRTESEVLMRGRILTDGEGPSAEIRRDVLLKMSRGIVRSMSGRWDADEKHVVRRVNLPSDHYAHVPEDEKGAKRWGLFFKKWRAMEGSLVGLGADPAAKIREMIDDVDTPEAARAYYRTLIPAAEHATIYEVREQLDEVRAMVHEIFSRLDAGGHDDERAEDLEPAEDPARAAEDADEERSEAEPDSAREPVEPQPGETTLALAEEWKSLLAGVEERATKHLGDLLKDLTGR